MKRNLAFHKISKYYPSFTNAVNNTYRETPELVVEKDTILSQEGTAQQGNPHSMAMYGITTLPLISCVQTRNLDTEGVCRRWIRCQKTNKTFFRTPLSWWQALGISSE